MREWIVQLPDNYLTTRPYPLVFGFHGLMYDAEWVALGEAPLTGPYFGIESEASDGAVFVAPQALAGGWSDQNGRDIAFVEAMLNFFREELCIDEARIFATGFSYGGIMTTRIGCVLYDAFRAIAPMSTSLPEECSGQLPPLPYLSTHGLSDPTISFAEGEKARDSYIERNGCLSEASAPNENGCVDYAGCDPNAPVRFCSFEGVHEPAPYAGKEIWRFFSSF